MFKSLKIERFKGFTLLELIVVIVVLGILAMLAVPTFNTVKERSADSVANKNASAVQRDFNAQAALAQSDSSITPSATGAWVVNGTNYSYTATAGNTGQNVTATKASSGGSGGGGTVIQTGSVNMMYFQYGTDAYWSADPSTMHVSFYNGGSTLGAVGDYFTITNLTLDSWCATNSCIDQSSLSLFNNQPLLITGASNSMGATYSFQLTSAQLGALQSASLANKSLAFNGTYTITR